MHLHEVSNWYHIRQVVTAAVNIWTPSPRKSQRRQRMKEHNVCSLCHHHLILHALYTMFFASLRHWEAYLNHSKIARHRRASHTVDFPWARMASWMSHLHYTTGPEWNAGQAPRLFLQKWKCNGPFLWPLGRRQCARAQTYTSIWWLSSLQ